MDGMDSARVSPEPVTTAFAPVFSRIPNAFCCSSSPDSQKSNPELIGPDVIPAGISATCCSRARCAQYALVLLPMIATSSPECRPWLSRKFAIETSRGLLPAVWSIPIASRLASTSTAAPAVTSAARLMHPTAPRMPTFVGREQAQIAPAKSRINQPPRKRTLRSNWLVRPRGM